MVPVPKLVNRKKGWKTACRVIIIAVAVFYLMTASVDREH